MFVQKKYIVIMFVLMILLLFMSFKSFTKEPIVEHYYHLNLMGEGHIWGIKDYKINITPDYLKAGEGKLYIKQKELRTNFFDLNVHAVINNKDEVLQSKSISGDTLVTENMITGSVEGPILTDGGRNVTLGDIQSIYAILKWRNENGVLHEETISLYNKND